MLVDFPPYRFGSHHVGAWRCWHQWLEPTPWTAEFRVWLAALPHLMWSSSVWGTELWGSRHHIPATPPDRYAFARDSCPTAISGWGPQRILFAVNGWFWSGPTPLVLGLRCPRYPAGLVWLTATAWSAQQCCFHTSQAGDSEPWIRCC